MLNPEEDCPRNVELYAKRRAEGRARVRWWIAEKRRKQAIIQESGHDDAERHAHACDEKMLALEDEIITTPATTLAGAIAKLRFYRTYHGWREPAEIDKDEQIVISALIDFERMMGGAA
jgi:predicted ATPase